ncbi:MAG: anthranilate synthase component I [Candidatus Omnitrophica bacterium CG11_big_fil_rev_8_21_14_0_20_64_10]|nr:MAG: anthranilate synthase component I [Candidatus Omnitrophica bacterium CG11_big_fil_rev_8_21_14_0_20_64_10]
MASRKRPENGCLPSEAAFLRLARRGNVIPVVREIPADFETPLSAYLKLAGAGRGPSFLLESVEGGERLARYSFLGAAPAFTISSRGHQMTLRRGRRTRRWRTAVDPLTELKSVLADYKEVPAPGLPRFTGGLVGYGGYDLARFLEPVGERLPDRLNLPDAFWMLSDTVVVFDHVERRMKIVANGIVEPGFKAGLPVRARRAYQKAVRRIEEQARKLQRPLKAPAPVRRRGRSLTVRSNMTPSDFLKKVSRAKRAIGRGEAIQIVLSQRFETPVSAPPFEIYRALRSLNPSPYMFYLDTGEAALVGSSPETLVRCERGVVEVRPIAGTRRRGRTAAADRAIAEGLLRDPKERAEHLMLVDLGRNDVGRVAQTGTVRVSDLMTVERYSHVMHLVSQVSGKLKKGLGPIEVLKAAFPAGTVTGAPKVRAMQIINELEPEARGPYAGAVGYIDFSGNLDTAIAIRTILVKGGRAFVQAGAGIVADSKPRRELAETRNKAAGMLEAIRLAEAGEA